MKKVSTVLIIFQLFLFVSLSSCTKKEMKEATSPYESMLAAAGSGTNLSYSQLYNYIESTVDGGFTLEAQCSYADQNNYTANFKGQYKDDKVDIGNPTVINGYTCTPLFQNFYSCVDVSSLLSAYGSTANFGLNYTKNSQTYTNSQNANIPSKLSMPLGQNFNFLFSGKQIKWNPETNVTGDYVLINISYNPRANENSTFTSPTIDTYKNIVLQDVVGTYTLSSNDLAPFPQGAYLNMNIYRGSYDILQNTTTGQNFMLASFSEIMITSRKQ